MPWKNGGGITHEIAAGDGWRLSVATIERDGPFSDFSGFDRTIVPIEGDGIELTFDDRTVTRLDRPFVPFGFRGEARVWCRLLGGTVRDLNVMTQRERWQHELLVCELQEPAPIADADLTFVYVLEGRVAGTAAGDTLRIERGVASVGESGESGRACVVSLRARSLAR